MTSAQAEAIMNNQKYAWNDSLFSNKIVAKPLYGKATYGRWKPIFDIHWIVSIFVYFLLGT
jgi:hypothetical protein